MDGELAAGQRVLEIPTSELLGVSRMPVRMAFRVLEQEGLLVRQGVRGFNVRPMTLENLVGAVEVRGVLEGLAARQAAERGITPDTKAKLKKCLEQGDRLFEKGYVTEEDLAEYHDINRRFHQTIIEASGNEVVAMALARNAQIPFASVDALAVDRENLGQEYRRFNFAHMQHHDAVEAMLLGQGGRAEAIMREHANVTLRYARLMSV